MNESTFGIGYTGKVVWHHGIGIYERIVHYAYARNGNAHNPTAYKAWDIFTVGKPGNGAPWLSCRKLKEAKQIIDAEFES
jgi:hypothetical protein